jgi:hypothetical protein
VGFLELLVGFVELSFELDDFLLVGIFHFGVFVSEVMAVVAGIGLLWI